MPGEARLASADLYADYHAWKGWGNLFAYDGDSAGYFSAEFGDLKIAGADVLEIGFGAGECLAWMKDRGARLCGVEISEASLQAAAKNGVRLLPADLPSVADRYEDAFDTIIALDVFEHFSIEKVAAYLSACDRMLRNGGKVLLRFPNAQKSFRPVAADGRSHPSLSAVEGCNRTLDCAAFPFSSEVRWQPSLPWPPFVSPLD